MLTAINIVYIVVTLAALVAFVIIMIAGFKRSVWWGLALLFLPFTTLIYAIKYWHEVKKPFLVYVGSNVVSLVLVGFLFTQLGGMQALHMAQQLGQGELTEQQAAQLMAANMNGMENLGVGGREEMLAQMRADPDLTEADIEQAERMLDQIDAVAKGGKESFQEGWQAQTEGGPLQLAMADPQQETQADELDAQIAAMEAEMAQLDAAADDRSTASDTAAQDAATVTALGYPMPDYAESPLKQSTHARPAKKSSGPVAVAEAEHYIGDVFSVTNQQGITRRAALKEVYPDSLEFQRRAAGGSITYKIARRDIQKLVLH